MLHRPAAALGCLLVSFSFAFAQPAAKRQKAPPPTVFKVANTTVSTDEFIYLYRKNHQDKPGEFTKAKVEEYLRLFIDFKLKVQEAKARGMDTTTAFVKEYNTYRAEVRKPFLPDNALTDSLARLTYERMREEVRASHILVALKEGASPADTLAAYNKAVDIQKKLAEGLDFAAAAERHSDDPSARTNKGDLGYFTALQMVYPFETAAYRLRVGDTSPPVRTRFGYHIIRLTDRRPARGEVEVSHIMVRIRENQDAEKAKDIIFTIYEQLQAGVSWDELCKQYSEDPSTREQRGKLKPFGTGAMAGVPEFERAAFELTAPGDISDPVRTPYGWHIIRLERKIPLASYDALAASLKGRVARDERTTISRHALLERYRQRFDFREDADTRESVMKLADSTLLAGKWRPAPLPGDPVLFTLAGENVPAREFISFAVKTQRPQTLAPAKYLEQLYNSFVESAILDLVEQDIIDRNPTFSYLLKEYYEGILLFEIMEKEVWTKASADSVGQRLYYTHNASKYQAPARTRAAIYSASADTAFPGLRELIAAGDERRIQDYAITHQIRIETGYFRKDEKEILGKVPWGAGVYSVENKGMYYLAWLKEVLAPGVMSFDEARPAIISDFQSVTEKQWLAQLRKKYPVKVNEKGKQYVIASLESK